MNSHRTALFTLVTAAMLVVGGGVRAVAAPPDRGVVAIPSTNGTIYVGWRLLASDPSDVEFDVLGVEGVEASPRRLNTERVRGSCNFVVDQAAGIRFITVQAWSKGTLLSDSHPTPLGDAAGYVSLKLRGKYPFSKTGIADLDGDGKLDFVIKQPQQVSDPGVWTNSQDTFKLEAYRSDGTFLWRKDLGWNIEQGIWWSPMIVTDFDGDGRAEIAVKTAPMDKDYRNAAGRVLEGPEYGSVLNGMTGEEIARVDWPARGRLEDWGDAKGNRASRHLMSFARLDGKRTSLLLMRGTYTTMLVDAYNLVDGKLVKVWSWNGDKETPQVRGQGMHGAHIVDVDGDGRDEIVLGAAVIDDNGKTLWNLQMGHPDVCYVTDVIPSRPGLEIAYGFETAQEKNGFCVVDAKTGKIIWGCDHMTTHIHSQGLLADIDPSNPGLEFYGGEKFLTDRWLYSAADGKLISREDFGSLAPNPIYWDKDFVKPYLNKEGEILKYKGAKLGNITGKVIAIADILGDWREEIITTVPGELRIYTTTIPASRQHTWLMEDPIYRNDVTLVSMGYLYPPQLTRPLTAETKP
jgi:rhamnogalacturonan endolyase